MLLEDVFAAIERRQRIRKKRSEEHGVMLKKRMEELQATMPEDKEAPPATARPKLNRCSVRASWR